MMAAMDKFYIISPLSQCASPEKQDKFLDYIQKIAPVTEASEPDCVAYAWFRSAEDNDVVPRHWLRGFEVYKHPEASTITHRASDEYKAFRAAVGSESLLERPSDLRPWYSTGLGYLRREAEKGSGCTSQYVVVDELKPKKGKKSEITEMLKRIVHLAQNEGSPFHAFLSLIVLDRGGQIDAETGTEDEGLYVLLRSESKSQLHSYIESHHEGGLNGFGNRWKAIEELCDWRRKTTWVGGGIGFMGR